MKLYDKFVADYNLLFVNSILSVEDVFKDIVDFLREEEVYDFVPVRTENNSDFKVRIAIEDDKGLYFKKNDIDFSKYKHSLILVDHVFGHNNYMIAFSDKGFYISSMGIHEDNNFLLYEREGNEEEINGRGLDYSYNHILLLLEIMIHGFTSNNNEEEEENIIDN